MQSTVQEICSEPLKIGSLPHVAAFNLGSAWTRPHSPQTDCFIIPCYSYACHKEVVQGSILLNITNLQSTVQEICSEPLKIGSLPHVAAFNLGSAWTRPHSPQTDCFIIPCYSYACHKEVVQGSILLNIRSPFEAMKGRYMPVTLGNCTVFKSPSLVPRDKQVLLWE